MKAFKQGIPWVFAAFACLLFLVSTSVSAASLSQDTAPSVSVLVNAADSEAPDATEQKAAAQTSVDAKADSAKKDDAAQIEAAQAQKQSAASEAKADDASERFTASDGKQFSKGAYQGSFKLVGYSGGGHTYSGTKATANRSVAADPSVIPLGSRIILNGVVYTVEDIGSGVKGQMIDIYFDTTDEAKALTADGWQYADVWLAVD